MDSGCEVVLVDVNGATTNGINGTNGAHEEAVPEMKTRSKAAGDVGDDDSAKPKVRLTRTTAAPKSADDKEASDGEKKDVAKKKSGRSGASDAAEEAKAPSKEPDAGAKAPTGAVAPSATAPKKKALERDDDSGINSRASSVSNDEVGSSARMRTRSSRASEASTSTSGRSAARVPIAIYEFDAASFDDDLSSRASTSKGAAPKRKAVYVEEMEEEDESAEPVAKRRAAFLVSAGAGIVTSLLYPLRKLRSGIAAVRPFKARPAVEVGEEEEGTSGADDAPSSSTAGQSVAQCAEQQPADAAKTCSLM